MKRCFVFCHGFGFDAAFWDTIRPYFIRERCVYLDLGYFGRERADIPYGVDLIGVGHSLGFARLSMLSVQFKILIGLQGFRCFLGYNRPLHERRERELEMFKKQFKVDPRRTLGGFRRRCGVFAEKDSLELLDVSRLSHDLENLSLNIQVSEDIPMLIVGAKDDPVVPPELIYDNFSVRKNAKISIIEKGCHCLGRLEPQHMYRKIMDFVHECA